MAKKLNDVYFVSKFFKTNLLVPVTPNNKFQAYLHR